MRVCLLDQLMSTTRGECTSPVTVVYLLCSHNRRNVTLSALRGIEEQVVEGAQSAVVLVDDGSTDGTADAVHAYYPDVEVIKADGSLFWSRAMALAQEIATRRSQPDYLFWLNDDVRLHADATQRLLSAAEARRQTSIVVGALADPFRGHLSYSGYRRGRSGRPQDLTRVTPNGELQRVDTFNGNVVFVPRAVYHRIGGVDGVFRHGVGDIDYGYRAAAAGYAAVLLGDYVGTCERNHVGGSWLDRDLPRISRLRLLFGPKGLDPRTQWVLQRRYGGSLWLLVFLGAYFRALRSILQGPPDILIPPAATAGTTSRRSPSRRQS